MKMIVNFPDKEIRKSIRSEFEYIYRGFKYLFPKIKIDTIIFTNNIQDEVNRLFPNTSFSSKREIAEMELSVLGKTLFTNENQIIFLYSLELFGYKKDDCIIRYSTFVHELTHAYLKQKLPKVTTDKFSLGVYQAGAIHLLDEYIADRTAYSLCCSGFPQLRNNLVDYLRLENIHISELLNSPENSMNINKEIENLNSSGDIIKFLESIKQPVFELTTVTTHLFASFHEFPEFLKEDFGLNSKFVDDRTQKFMDLLMMMYLQEDYNFMGDMEVISNFYSLYGFRLDTTHGMERKCHVEFI